MEPTQSINRFNQAYINMLSSVRRIFIGKIGCHFHVPVGLVNLT